MAVSLSEVANVHTEGPRWLVHPNPQPDAQMRLFCLGAAGSGASVFRALAPKLDARIEMCAIQLPGRESRRNEAFLTDVHVIVEQLADALEPLLDKPFAILGHSLGGLLGYELAVELSRFDQTPEHLVVLGTPAPHLERTRPTVHDRGEQALRDYLVRMAGTPGAVLETRWLFNMYAPILRADLEVFETYVHGKQEKLTCPITCWGGQDDSHVDESLLLQWSGHTSGAFATKMWPGNHFFLRGNEAAFSSHIESLLLP